MQFHPDTERLGVAATVTILAVTLAVVFGLMELGVLA